MEDVDRDAGRQPCPEIAVEFEGVAGPATGAHEWCREQDDSAECGIRRLCGQRLDEQRAADGMAHDDCPIAEGRHLPLDVRHPARLAGVTFRWHPRIADLKPFAQLGAQALDELVVPLVVCALAAALDEQGLSRYGHEARIPVYSVAMVDVRTATRDDIEACARVLAMAFQDDPGTINFEPDDEPRRRVLPAFFRSFVAASLDEDGDILVAGQPIEGVASWFGPDHHGPSPDAMGANGFGDVLAVAGPESAERLLAMVGEIERQHTLLADGPHFRLEFYGVLPERQGTGLGSALIEHAHARADELGLPTYLETMSERNVGFYQRRGYAVVGEFVVGGSTRAWGMVRQPSRR